MKWAGLGCLVLLWAGCTKGPGRTPIDQAVLEVVSAPVGAEPRLLVDGGDVAGREKLLEVLDEFKRTPVRVHVVWVREIAPDDRELRNYRGRAIQQYWDPKGLSGKARGVLEYKGRTAPLEMVPLRLLLAQASVEPVSDPIRRTSP